MKSDGPQVYMVDNSNIASPMSKSVPQEQLVSRDRTEQQAEYSLASEHTKFDKSAELNITETESGEQQQQQQQAAPPPAVTAAEHVTTQQKHVTTQQEHVAGQQEHVSSQDHPPGGKLHNGMKVGKNKLENSEQRKTHDL